MTEDHPTPRRLAAYQAGQLSPGDEDEIQEHLVACRECTAALLSLPQFQELMEAEDLETVARPEELPGPGQTRASWQAVQARLAASRAAAPAPPVRRFRRLTTSPRAFFALAAGLLVCLIGFPLWIATQRGPRAGAPLAAYPLGDGEVTRGVGSGQPFVVRLAEGPAVLALPLPARASFPAYRIEIRTPGGKLRLFANALPLPVAVGPAGTRAPATSDRPPQVLAIIVGRGQLAAGDYRLRLVGLRGSHPEVIAEHALRVPGS